MIGHDVTALLPDFRQEAQSLMVDTATITRPGGEATFDPNTGELTPAAGTVVYTGPCRLRQPTASESEILFGDETISVSRFIVCLPHDAVGLQIGDVVTLVDVDVVTHEGQIVTEDGELVDAGPVPVGDPDVLTRQFRIMSVPLSTFTIYKGYPCEVVE